MQVEVPSSDRRRVRREVAVQSPDARRWLFLSDLLAVFASTFIIVALKRIIGIDIVDSWSAQVSHVALFIVFDLLLVLRLGMYGQYEVRQRFSRIDDLAAVTQATFIAASVAVFLSILSKGYFLGFTDYSRAYIALAVVLPYSALCFGRVVLNNRQEKRFAVGQFLSKALIVGAGERTEEFLRWLGDNPGTGVLGVRSSIDLEATEISELQLKLAEELEHVRPHELIIALEEPRPEAQELLVRECQMKGVSVRSLPGVFDTFKQTWFEYAGLPMATLFETSGDHFARRIKRIADAIASAIGLVVLSPFLLLIGILIVVEDRGSVFYRQERVGLYGSIFRFWKFRTMRVNGDEILNRHLAENPEAKEEWDAFQKLKKDPRVTRIGRLLRKTSIDELPQLINVMFGEMSLVGPRPPLPAQIEEYGTKFVFSQVRPGISGLWQVSGRNEIDFEGRIDLDVYYVENWSFWLDIKILLKTLKVVVRGNGAY